MRCTPRRSASPTNPGKRTALRELSLTGFVSLFALATRSIGNEIHRQPENRQAEKKDILRIIPEILIEARKAAQLSQEVLAEKLDVSKGTVGNWESKGNGVSEDNLRKLCQILGITESVLRGELPKEELRDGANAGPAGTWKHLGTDTLQNTLRDLAGRLPRVQQSERKFVLGNLREVLDELEQREHTPEVSSKPKSAAARAAAAAGKSLETDP